MPLGSNCHFLFNAAFSLCKRWSFVVGTNCKTLDSVNRMESFLLVGAYSFVDALGKMLISCSCLHKGSTDVFWKRDSVAEVDNASVVPVYDDSSPLSNSSKIRMNLSQQISTISIIHKSTHSRSTSTISTHSTFHIDECNRSSGHLDIPSRLSLEMNTFCSDKSEEFVEVKIASLPYYSNPRRQQQEKDGQTKRHSFLGRTKRKHRVRKLLAEDVAHRQSRSGRTCDREKHEENRCVA